MANWLTKLGLALGVARKNEQADQETALKKQMLRMQMQKAQDANETRRQKILADREENKYKTEVKPFSTGVPSSVAMPAISAAAGPMGAALSGMTGIPGFTGAQAIKRMTAGLDLPAAGQEFPVNDPVNTTQSVWDKMQEDQQKQNAAIALKRTVSGDAEMMDSRLKDQDARKYTDMTAAEKARIDATTRGQDIGRATSFGVAGMADKRARDQMAQQLGIENRKYTDLTAADKERSATTRQGQWLGAAASVLTPIEKKVLDVLAPGTKMPQPEIDARASGDYLVKEADQNVKNAIELFKSSPVKAQVAYDKAILVQGAIHKIAVSTDAKKAVAKARTSGDRRDVEYANGLMDKIGMTPEEKLLAFRGQ